MSILNDFLKVSYLSLLTSLTQQRLNRTPEPDQITTDSMAVSDYDRAVDASLVIVYALDIQVLKLLSREIPRPLKGLDLACGPGIFTAWMAQFLNLESVHGVDLSSPMLDCSRKRFEKLMPKCSFEFHNQSVTDLSRFPDRSFNLVTFMDAAHHLPNLQDVETVLKEAERVCDPEGLVFVSDLVRPKSERIFRLYYDWIAQRNLLFDLKAHNLDFQNSLHAAWTCEELASCIPKDTQKSWFQVYPFGLKYLNLLIGLPKNHPGISLKSLDNTLGKKLVPQHLSGLWNLTAPAFKYTSRVKQIR